MIREALAIVTRSALSACKTLPMIAVQIADFFILHQDFSRKSVCIQNMLVRVVGFVAYRWLMGVDTILGNTLPVKEITIVLSVIVSLLFGKKND